MAWRGDFRSGQKIRSAADHTLALNLEVPLAIPHPFLKPAPSTRKPISKTRRALAGRACAQPEQAVGIGSRVIRVRDDLHGDELEPSRTGLTGTVIGFQYADPARPQIVYDGDSDAVPTFANLSEIRPL